MGNVPYDISGWDYENPQSQEQVKPQYKKPSPYANSPYASLYTAWEQNATAPQPKPKKKGKAGKAFARFLLMLALVAGVCAVTVFVLNGYWQSQNQLLMQTMDNRIAVLQEQIQQLQEDRKQDVPAAPVTGMTPKQVFNENVVSVVMVYGEGGSSVPGMSGVYATTGSGFVLTEDGYIVTNYHVVENMSYLSVTTYDGTEYEAELIGYDSVNDLALLKTEASGLQAVKIGSSDALSVGDQVVAIGNPLGELTSTLTVGYISAKDRVVSTDSTTISMLQTDAAINSGNSGGPLFNMAGEVVGITTSKYSGTTASGASIEGVSFAIPSDDAMAVLDDLMEFGYVRSTYLGIMAREVNASVAADYGLPAGVYVASVNPGGSADAAGVKTGDIILNLGGYDTGSQHELTRALRRLEAGRPTTITVYRNGTRINLEITLAERPRDLE